MIRVIAQDNLTIETHEPVGAAMVQQLTAFDEIRRAEIASIRAFVDSQKHRLKGRVLDFGAGKPGTCREPQPYRDLVDPQAEYVPYDLGDEWPKGDFDTILCTQVLQYVDDPWTLMFNFRGLVTDGNTLVLTYGANWPECDREDRWRFTQAGMDHMLRRADFDIEVHERRAELVIGCNTFALGYGVVAVAR